ncbi:MAG TPA: NHL repeat-containing protein [Thermoanaerobaculia bacterium]|jgi:sugar lactone lactonase YvrE|nr:NHL repeat-containing protein [Thermoanaerobaculia bacterium]
MKKNLPALSLLGLILVAVPMAVAEEAVRELGQPDFRGFMPNRLDARGLYQPWGVAIDRSRAPNGIWVVDANNNRVLGWRDVTALRNGARADVVLGQPDAYTNTCNTGGISASSLCIVESPTFSFAYEPGVAVDPEGNVYVVDQRNFRILGYRRPFDTDRVADVLIGQQKFDQAEPIPTIDRLYNPHGLATDPQGNLYLGDEVRVVEYDRPLATDGKADRAFGQPGVDTFNYPADPAAADQVAYADGVAVDAQGRLYVADGWMDRVMVWKEPLARQGAADLVFSQGPPPACDFSGCNQKGIAVEPDGDLWVGGITKGKIFGYRAPADGDIGDIDPDRIILAAYPAKPPASALPGQPWFAAGGMAVDETGTLWMADVNRVLGFVDPWSGDGLADRFLGQARPDEVEANLVDREGFKLPAGIARDLRSSPPHLYVIDTLNSRVLGWKDAESLANGQPADLVLGQPDRWSSGCNTGGRSLASLCLGQNFPGIAVDAQGTVWVSDAGNQRVVGYRSPFKTDRIADRVIGGRLGCVTGPRGLCIPGGVAVDRDGNLYVADIGNNRVLEFDQPMRRDTTADRVIGADGFHQRFCSYKYPVTCFSEENGTHPGLNIYGGLLAMDPAGRLLVGGGGYVYVFEQPLKAPNRSRKLFDVSATGHYSTGLRGLAVDSAGRIYVTDNSYVYGFSPSGAGPFLELGEPCTIGNSSGLPENLGPASICNAMGVAVGPGDDELFVSDAEANRVLVFELP